jgi:hypothetical protein
VRGLGYAVIREQPHQLATEIACRHQQHREWDRAQPSGQHGGQHDQAEHGAAGADQGISGIEDAVSQPDQHRCRDQHGQHPEGPEAILKQRPGQQDHHEVGQQVGHAAMGQCPREH